MQFYLFIYLLCSGQKFAEFRCQWLSAKGYWDKSQNKLKKKHWSGLNLKGYPNPFPRAVFQFLCNYLQYRQMPVKKVLWPWHLIKLYGFKTTTVVSCLLKQMGNENSFLFRLYAVLTLMSIPELCNVLVFY